jgi:hypothetical protein
LRRHRVREVPGDALCLPLERFQPVVALARRKSVLEARLDALLPLRPLDLGKGSLGGSFASSATVAV